jgi:hypothetical protein
MFFDMCRADHLDVALNDASGDLVTASASGETSVNVLDANLELHKHYGDLA